MHSQLGPTADRWLQTGCKMSTKTTLGHLGLVKKLTEALPSCVTLLKASAASFTAATLHP